MYAELTRAPRLASKLLPVSWHSVFPRGLVALFGTLAFSIAFALAIGHPETAILLWSFSLAVFWLAWVIPPPPRTSRPRWWYLKIAGQLLAWVLVWSGGGCW